MKKSDKVIVTRLAAGRFVGVAEAASALKVSRQSIYIYLNGWPKVLGPKKRARLIVVDARQAGVN